MSALGLHRQGPTQGVETEHRVGPGHERHSGDRLLGNQIPVHRVAEGFVDAHAVDVHRQALGRAEQGRGGEAVIIDVGLKRIVLALADADAAEVVVQVIRQIQRLLALHVLAICGLYIRGYLIQWQAQAQQW